MNVISIVHICVYIHTNMLHAFTVLEMKPLLSVRHAARPCPWVCKEMTFNVQRRGVGAGRCWL